MATGQYKVFLYNKIPLKMVLFTLMPPLHYCDGIFCTNILQEYNQTKPNQTKPNYCYSVVIRKKKYNEQNLKITEQKTLNFSYNVSLFSLCHELVHEMSSYRLDKSSKRLLQLIRTIKHCFQF